MSDTRQDSERLAEMARHADVLMQKNHALAAALSRASKELQIAKSQLVALSNPPQTLAVFRSIDGSYTDDDGVRHTTALVAVNGRVMSVAVSPQVPVHRLATGQMVLLNDNLIVADTREIPATGPVRVVQAALDDGRLQVADQSGALSLVLRAGALAHTDIKPGSTICLDPYGMVALEVIAQPEAADLVLEEVPDTTFEDIGGLDAQIAQIRDAVELPFAHAHAFQRYHLVPPRGVLLYGPPGNGKTLIAKALAHALAERQGGNGVFLSIKGPQLLSKYVGESERLLRHIFERARDHARDGRPVVVFIDEMDSLLRTRGSGVSSDVETTIVPQFLSELDGVESLHNVIIIGASNRIDMIDPAVLRPGRLDIKVHIARPNKQSAAAILSHYLTADLPFESGQSAQSVIETMIADIFARTQDRLVCQLQVRNHGQASAGVGTQPVGTQTVSTQPIYLADLISGAMLRNIVDRAKTAAIKATIAAQHTPSSVASSTESHAESNFAPAADQELTYMPISMQIIHQAIELEYDALVAQSSEANPAQWARLNDIATDGDVVAMITVAASDTRAASAANTNDARDASVANATNDTAEASEVAEAIDVADVAAASKSK